MIPQGNKGVTGCPLNPCQPAGLSPTEKTFERMNVTPAKKAVLAGTGPGLPA